MLAALLRLPTLDVQSLWADEAFTWTIAAANLGDAARQIPHTESTPPLSYALEWLWVHVAGDSTFALRALPALLGVGTVAAVAAAGTAWRSRGAGLIAAGLTAVNPFMVWYSQEARAYALLALLGAVGFLALVRALATAERRWIVAWGAASAAALATHYFAVFVVAPEAAWLLVRLRRRDSMVAVGAVAAVLVALAPLAAYQADHVPRPWTARFTTLDQALATAQELLVGPRWTWLVHRPGVLVLGVLAGALAGGLLCSGAERRAAALPASVAAVGIGAPLLVSLVGTNYLAPRNVIAVWPLLALLVGAGATAWPRPRVAAAAVAATGVGMAGITMAGALDRDLQRDDWRDVLGSVPAAEAPRAVRVLQGFDDSRVVQRYLPSSRRLEGASPPVREVLVVGRPASAPAAFVTSPVAGLQRVAFRQIGAIAVARFTAASPVALPPPAPPDPATLLLQDPRDG